jgi:hypothetical protein
VVPATEDDTSPFLEWRILCDKRSGGILISDPAAWRCPGGEHNRS